MKFIVRTYEWEQHEPDVVNDHVYESFENAKKFFDMTVKLNTDRKVKQAKIEILIILDSHVF